MAAHAHDHTLRAVEALEVPSGFTVLLPEGTWVVVQQSPRRPFTAMTELGGLVRIDGKDADALGPELVEAARRPSPSARAAAEGPFHEEKVWDALREVYDPEIPATSSSSGSSTASRPTGGRRAQGPDRDDAHRAGVRHRAGARRGRPPQGARVPGVKEAEVELVFDPPWDPSRMSDAAKLQLGFM